MDISSFSRDGLIGAGRSYKAQDGAVIRGNRVPAPKSRIAFDSWDLNTLGNLFPEKNGELKIPSSQWVSRFP